MKVKVFNLIILDESGSMESIKKPAVDGLNETLQSIQSAQETHKELQQHHVTLVSFNSNGVKTIFDNLPVSEIKLLTNQDYRPHASTPLLDAMGSSLNKLRRQLDEKEKNQVLVTIITDGEENSSKEYDGKSIKKLVQELRESGWVFTYIGTNQDVDAVAESLSINNRMSFENSREGTQRMMTQERQSRQAFYGKVSCNMSGENLNLQEDFFEEKGKVQEEVKKDSEEISKKSRFSSLKNIFGK